MTKMKKFQSFALLLFASLFLSACGGGFGASSWPGLLYDEQNNTVYIAYNQHLYALQAENGAPVWRFPADSDNGLSFYAAPTLAENGDLIVGSYDNRIFSLNPESNGSQNWVFSVAEDRFIGSIAIGGSDLFAPNADNSLYAISESGQSRWSFAANDALWSTPVSNGENVYFASMDSNLYALRASNGNKLWERDLGGTVVADLAIDDSGIIYLGTFNQEILAINGANGLVKWSKPTEGWIWGGPSVVDGIVYVGDLEGFLYAFDANTGRELWRVTADGAIASSPLIANEHVYIGTENGQVMSVDLAGRIQWTKTIVGQAYGTPILAGDLIVIGLVEGDNVAIAFDFNGNQVWAFAE